MLAMKHLNVKNITIKVIKDHCKFTGTITAITPAASLLLLLLFPKPQLQYTTSTNAITKL